MILIRDISIIKKELPKIRRAIRRHKAILYCQDESTIRLTAVLAKTLQGGGAKVALCGSNPLSTNDAVAAALAEEGVKIWAYKGETRGLLQIPNKCNQF